MKYTVQYERTQYAYVEVEAESIADALEKADDYYDEHFEEVDRDFDDSSAEYGKAVVDVRRVEE